MIGRMVTGTAPPEARRRTAGVTLPRPGTHRRPASGQSSRGRGDEKCRRRCLRSARPQSERDLAAEEIVMTTLADRPHTALMVIDVQNGVVGEAYERDAVVANIGALV